MSEKAVTPPGDRFLSSAPTPFASESPSYITTTTQRARRTIVRVFTVTESRVEETIELIDGQQPFLYFDRGAGGGTHFFAHHKVVAERGDGLCLVDRVSVAEESYGRYWFMPELENDTERALVLVRTGKNCRIRPYVKNPRIRVLASDKVGHKTAMLISSPGGEFVVQRPDHLFEGRALLSVLWDGNKLHTHEQEDPEDATTRIKLTYI
jgi:hypothetical protein